MSTNRAARPALLKPMARGAAGVLCLAGSFAVWSGWGCTAVPVCVRDGQCTPDLAPGPDLLPDLSPGVTSRQVLAQAIVGTPQWLGVGNFKGQTELMLAVGQGGATRVLRYAVKGTLAATGQHDLLTGDGVAINAAQLATIYNGAAGSGGPVLLMTYSQMLGAPPQLVNTYNRCTYEQYATAGRCFKDEVYGATTLAGVAADPSGGLVVLGTGAGLVAYDATQQKSTAQPGAVTGVAVADLDGDKRADVVSAIAGGLWVHLNQGSGAGGVMLKGSVLCSACAPAPRQAILAADLDGGGGLDVVVVDGTRALALPVTVRAAGDGGGGISVGATVETALGEDLLSSGGAVVAGDLSGDGKADLVVLRPSTKRLEVYRGLGTGAFESVPSWVGDSASGAAIDLGAAPYAGLWADVNGDGRADLVVASPTGLRVLPGA